MRTQHYRTDENMNFDKCSEKELLNACIQGDKKAWDVFVEKYTDLEKHQTL